MENKTLNAAEQLSDRDLSEQIKKVTKESHVRAENTELMLSFQRGNITLQQYKLLLCSLHEIYEALEEELDRNADHPAVAPVYFPAELHRLDAIRRDLDFFYGHAWRDHVVVPEETHRYCHRIRQIGKEHPEFLVAHAYTRYLGDLSGGQVLSRMAQRAMGLRSGRGLDFFSFPGVSSPNLFKQLYRGRINSLELTEQQRTGLLDEAVRAFAFNIQVFEGLQKMLQQSDTDRKSQTASSTRCSPQTAVQTAITAPLIRMALGLFVALTTVSVGMYAL